MVFQNMMNKKCKYIFLFLSKAYIITKLKISLDSVLLIYLIIFAVIDYKINIIPNIILCSMLLDYLVIMNHNGLIIKDLYIFVLVSFIFITLYFAKDSVFFAGDIKYICLLSLYMKEEVISLLFFIGIINMVIHLCLNKKNIPFAPSALIAMLVLRRF